MLSKVIVAVTGAIFVASALIAFPTVGKASYQVLSDTEMDQITAGDLTGMWRGSDGLTYFVRQIGNAVFWYGEKVDPSSWCCANVAYGTINNGQATLAWAGVPKKPDYGGGTLIVQISNDNFMYTLAKSGVVGGVLIPGVFGGTTDTTTFAKQ